jgi:hypothetical protein
MIAGTDEWRQAIQDANAQVMELIQTYPELAKYLNNEGGRLTISDEGLNAFAEKQEAAVNSSYRASLSG